jgi:hypothetical protein
MSWSRLYDSVFECAEPPETSIIEDDDALDAWLLDKKANEDGEKKAAKSKLPEKNHQENMTMLEGYYSEQCTCGASKHKVKGLGERPQHAADCSWGKYIYYTREEKDRIADQIYGRNPQAIKNIMNNEKDIIDNQGKVEEQHLRKRRSRMMLGMQYKQGKSGNVKKY